MASGKLSVYFAVLSETLDDAEQDVYICVTEKSFFDECECMQDDPGDDDYIRISEAMKACGYSERAESVYDANVDKIEDFDVKGFASQLAAHGIRMIYSKKFAECAME